MKRRGAIGSLLATAALAGSVVLAVACAPTEVVLADVPADAAPSISSPCVTSDDCPTGAYCAAPTCGAAAGRCEKVPLFCDALPAPSCGCDGVTYWNDCLRRQAGVPLRAPGECVEAVASCGGRENKACPGTGASCARIVNGEQPCRGLDAPGTCWRLPTECPPEGPALAPVFAPCGPTPSGACVDACRAILSEKPHHALPRDCKPR